MRKLLRKLFPIEYFANPGALHPYVLPVVRSLQAKDYDAVLKAFDGLSPGEITLLNEGISELIVQDDLLDDWFNESNGPALACLLRGTLLLKRAWVYRGWGRGSEVSEDSFKQMYAALDRAQKSMIPIMDDPVYGSEACARLIKVCKGLSANWEDLDFLLKKMWSFGHINMIGEVYYLIASCEKWLGSHEKMYRFAEDRAKLASKHPELGALVAAAHFERHMYWERFDEDQAKADAFKANVMYIEDIINFRDKLLEAYSPDNPDHVIAHNIIAGVCCEFNLFAVATPCFMVMNKRATPYPWDFLGDDFLQYGYNEAMVFKKDYLKKDGFFDRYQS